MFEAPYYLAKPLLFIETLKPVLHALLSDQNIPFSKQTVRENLLTPKNLDF